MRNFFLRKSSKEIARDRLKILLISDRVNCSVEVLELIKKDIIKVLSKYMKIDAAHMEIQINKTSKVNRNSKNPILNANIPILDMNQ